MRQLVDLKREHAVAACWQGMSFVVARYLASRSEPESGRLGRVTFRRSKNLSGHKAPVLRRQVCLAI